MKLWAGEIDSYNIVANAQDKLDKLRAAEPRAGYFDEMLASLPPMWRHEGSTAVINVHGALVAGDAGYLRIFGVTGYDNILKATLAAATHEDTKALLFDMSTPGGDVNGLIEACEDLGQITAMKPSAVYTADMMASAGYWLASAIKENHITSGPTAAVGSIGIIKIHTETSKRMEDAGVKVTVIRAGKYKAELNSIEPITAEIHERAQSQINDIHAMFRTQVAKGRPELSASDLAEVSEGQVFLGQRAVKAGLADKVGSFSLALNLLDKRKQSRDTSSKSKGKTMALTPEQLKAIAGGAPLQSFNLNVDGTEMSASEIEAYAAQVRQDAAAKQAKTAEDARVTAAAQAATANPATAPPEGVVALLEKQVATANAKILELTVAATASAAATAAHAELLTIARGATAQMLIPMGGTSAAVDGMDAAAVIAEHARVKPLFLAKFPAGRQSVPGQDDGGTKKTANALPLGFEFAVKTAPSAKR